MSEEKSSHQFTEKIRDCKGPTPRRNIVRGLPQSLFYAASITLISLSLISWANHRSVSENVLSLEDRARKILVETPLIDGHNDLAYLIRNEFGDRINFPNFTDAFVNGTLTGHVDLPRLSKGKVGGTFWSVYVDCPADGMDFSDSNYAESMRVTAAQIDLVTRLQRRHPEVFSKPPNGTTALDVFRSGKILSPMGIEGLHSIGNSYAHLRVFYDLGVRYATLTHNCHNIFADAAMTITQDGHLMKSEPLWHGVSENGKRVVHEMNRLGMIVDISHTSAETMRDVLGRGKDSWTGSAAPVIFSHSSAYAICPHPRNVPDDVLQLVKETGSVVMVTFAPDFVSCVATNRSNGLPEFDPQNNTMSHVIDHIVYIGELIGYQHVGLGSDFDGVPFTPTGLDDVSSFPDLVVGLLKRGVSDQEVAGVVGGNVLRVWKKVDEVAMRMQAEETPPVED